MFSGVQHYIIKPFLKIILKSIIRRFLGDILRIIMYNILFIYFGQGSINIDDKYDDIEKR